MEMHERLIILRKNYLRLQQKTLGVMIGFDHNMISAIELNKPVKQDMKLLLADRICAKYPVNKEWLLHGKWPMFIYPYPDEQGACRGSLKNKDM